MSEAKVLFEEFWSWRMKESPELASFCGNHEHDERLDDVSLQGYERRQKAAEGFLSRCEQIQKSGNMNEDESYNVKLLAEDIRIYLAGMKYKGYLLPISYAEGIHIDFELFISWMDFTSVESFRKYVCRLGALPTRIKQVEELLRAGVAEGLTMHPQSMKGVDEEFECLEKEPNETIFYQPFKSAPTDLDLAALKSETLACIKDKVQPAFKALHSYISKEYSQHLRAKEGVSSLPSGRAFYEECLKWHISVDLTPEEVHQKGLQEVARIKEQMMKIIDQIGFKGSFKEFLESLRQNEEFYFKDKASLMEGYEDLCHNIIRPKLKELFYSMPKSPLVIESTPESRPNAPAGYYLAGTLDGSRPGKFYVNANDMKMCPKYEMVTLSLHEGEPGHHFQSMYAIEMKGVPMFRQYLEDMNYYAAPSRFPIHTAYIEGWGLYCEYLGEELGLYEDPYSMFGHLSFEMHRACRLVVDTGLHAFSWTFDEAKKQLMENTALSEAFIDSEVQRYITWPGQACGYKIGELKIKELRQHATEKLGEKFDVRDFHEVVLKAGMVPMNVLQLAVEEYVKHKST